MRPPSEAQQFAVRGVFPDKNEMRRTACGEVAGGSETPRALAGHLTETLGAGVG